MTSGYSRIASNAAGATSALKMPPSTPPTLRSRKNCVRWFGLGRSSASCPWATMAATKNPL
jgi:hypothetical protein